MKRINKIFIGIIVIGLVTIIVDRDYTVGALVASAICGAVGAWIIFE